MSRLLKRTVTAIEPGPPLLLQLAPVIKLSDDQLLELCAINRDLRIERTSEGDLLIMPPTGGETSTTNFELTGQFRDWVRTDGTGVGFDSSGGFRLPNRAMRSPDAAWVRRSRWEALTPEQRRHFPPLCPDFVIELRSPSDRLAGVPFEGLRTAQAKMQEYVDNGAQLGWLIDPPDRKVYIYRPGAPVEVLDDPRTISGDPLLPGFALDVGKLWPS